MNNVFRVFIVDDDYISNIITENVLQRVNAVSQLQTFQNAPEALHTLKEQRVAPITTTVIDLVFLDIFMPIMDGFEFLAELEKLPAYQRRELAVILLSGSELPFVTNKFRQFASIKAQLLKPLTEEAVSQVLERIISDTKTAR